MVKTIDFRFVKQQADFLAVLEHYSLAPQGKGVSRAILCPFHKDSKASCKINLGRKIFNCFGCRAHGNVIDFVRLKEGFGEDELRKAARKVAEICSIPLMPPDEHVPEAATKPVEARLAPETTKEPSKAQSPHHEAPGASGEVLRNEPLKPAFVERFRSKLLPAQEHPYLLTRGLTPTVIEHFELAFCPAESRSMMKNRVVIPIHAVGGGLLAYAGRWIGSEDTLPEGESRYKLPAKFHKSLVLYNLHRVLGRKHLVVVEGCFSVFRLCALGVPAVALLGSSIAAEQIALLREAEVRYLTVLLDGDAAGRGAAPAMMEQLCREPLLCKFALLPDGTQPDTVPELVLRELLRLPR